MLGFGKVETPDGCRYYASLEEMPAPVRERLRELSYRWGETYDAYLVNEGPREYFWLPDHAGVVAFTRWGRHCQVVGGALAPPDLREKLVEQTIEYARRRHWSISFYNIARDHTQLFADRGCEISKCGEEPIIALDRTEWRGKPYEWVRRQENFCKRQGLEVVEVEADPDDPAYRDELAPELRAISEEHVSATLHGRELKFFVGSFDPLELQHRRLFVARKEGSVEAFVVCNPCLEGEMWAVEIYRKRREATRGVVPFTIMAALRKLKSEDVAYASLSLIPLLRCDPKLHKGSWLFYVVANFWWKRLNWIFDMKGIYHFKSRFRPEYREMFVAVYPKVTAGSMFAMGMVWEVIKFNPLRLVRRGWRKVGSNRKTMAKPGWRPERVVRALKPGAKKKRTDPAHPAVPAPSGKHDDGAQPQEGAAKEQVAAADSWARRA